MDIGLSAGRIGRYLGAYALGIISCVLLTPVELNLAGRALWLGYPVFAPVGCVLYFLHLTPPYVFGSVTGYWLAGSPVLAPMVLELVAVFSGTPQWHRWRPLWWRFPLGFVGTLGVYYTAAASI